MPMIKIFHTIFWGSSSPPHQVSVNSTLQLPTSNKETGRRDQFPLWTQQRQKALTFFGSCLCLFLATRVGISPLFFLCHSFHSRDGCLNQRVRDHGKFICSHNRILLASCPGDGRWGQLTYISIRSCIPGYLIISSAWLSTIRAQNWVLSHGPMA